MFAAPLYLCHQNTKQKQVTTALGAASIEQDKPSRQAFSIVTAALIVGLDSIGFAVALAALMFSGQLAPGLATGITAVLASSIVLSLTVGTFSQLRTNMAGAQDIGVAILAVTLVSAVAGLAPDARVPTAFAIIAASTLATGILLFTIGALGAGRFVRYFPLEVLAGFMAATGFLLLMGGVAMVAHVDADFTGMLQVRRMEQFVPLITALLLAALIYFAMTHFRKPFLLLGILLCVIGLFHLWRQVAGVSMMEATANNWLPQVPDVTGISLAFPTLLNGVDWDAVTSATPTIASVAAISLFAALLNISAIEFATGHDLNLDREMRIAGGANIMVTAVGGPPGYTDLASTLLLQKFGITKRGVGYCVAAVEFLGLWYAVTIAMSVPTFVAGGLILYYGFDLVKDWLISTRKIYSKREWSVVLLIVVIAVFYSFLFAILAGLLIATILFAYSYANSPVVRQTTDLASLPSTTERPPADARLLAEYGRAIRIFRLQGFLFFGTSEQVVSQIRSATQEASGLKSVIIDFARVTEMDSASANAFKRIIALSKSNQFSIILSGLNESLKETLLRASVAPDEQDHVTFATDLDVALEQAETLLLGSDRNETSTASLAERYARTPEEAEAFEQLFAEMERRNHPPGDHLVVAGMPANEVLFIESGRAVVRRIQADGKFKRLRTMLPGAIVGDVGYSLGGNRTADVTAEIPTTTLSISTKQMEKLARSKPALAILFNSLLNRALAEKVLTANRMTEHAG